MDFNKNNFISKPIIMNKNISKNSDFLKRLGRKATGEAPVKVNKIIELYNARKIAQIQTAENVIMKLISKDPKDQKKGFKQAEKIIEKYKEVEPLSHRLREKTTIRKEHKRQQRTVAASKIQKLVKGKISFEVVSKEQAFKDKVINVKVKSKQIGSAVAYDIEAFIAKAFLVARKQIPKDAKFMIWASCKFRLLHGAHDSEVMKTPHTGKHDSTHLSKFLEDLSPNL